MRWSVATVFFFLILTYGTPFLFAQACGDAGGKISVSPSSLDFGTVEVGESSSILTFTIQDANQTVMDVLEITSQNSRFKIVKAPPIPFCILGNRIR